MSATNHVEEGSEEAPLKDEAKRTRGRARRPLQTTETSGRRGRNRRNVSASGDDEDESPVKGKTASEKPKPTLKKKSPLAKQQPAAKQVSQRKESTSSDPEQKDKPAPINRKTQSRARKASTSSNEEAGSTSPKAKLSEPSVKKPASTPAPAAGPFGFFGAMHALLKSKKDQSFSEPGKKKKPAGFGLGGNRKRKGLVGGKKDVKKAPPAAAAAANRSGH